MIAVINQNSTDFSIQIHRTPDGYEHGIVAREDWIGRGCLWGWYDKRETIKYSGSQKFGARGNKTVGQPVEI